MRWKIQTSFCFLVFSFLSAEVFANRLASMVGARCAGQGQFSETECKASRDEAKNSGCITQAEYNWANTSAVAVGCFLGSPKFVCPCGCFDAEARVLMQGDYGPEYVRAADVSKENIAYSLSDSATLSSLSRETRAIIRTTAGPEEPKLYKIYYDGKSLALSQNHGVVLANGSVTTAKELKSGDILLGADGSLKTISSIERVPASDGNVYNFLTEGSSYNSHLVIAEDLVVGDLMWQNTYANQLYNVVIRQ